MIVTDEGGGFFMFFHVLDKNAPIAPLEASLCSSFPCSALRELSASFKMARSIIDLWVTD